MINVISTASTNLVTAAIALTSPLTIEPPRLFEHPAVEEHASAAAEQETYTNASWLNFNAIEFAAKTSDGIIEAIGYSERGTHIINSLIDGSYAVGTAVSIISNDVSTWNERLKRFSISQQIANQEKQLQIAFAALHNLLPSADLSLLEDAAPFYALVKELEWQPNIWSDEGEVAFEWKHEGKHAIVSFDGDGYYGYAMLVSDGFKPGANDMPLPNTIPSDLREYLSVA